MSADKHILSAVWTVKVGQIETMLMRIVKDWGSWHFGGSGGGGGRGGDTTPKNPKPKNPPTYHQNPTKKPPEIYCPDWDEGSCTRGGMGTKGEGPLLQMFRKTARTNNFHSTTRFGNLWKKGKKTIRKYLRRKRLRNQNI